MAARRLGSFQRRHGAEHQLSDRTLAQVVVIVDHGMPVFRWPPRHHSHALARMAKGMTLNRGPGQTETLGDRTLWRP